MCKGNGNLQEPYGVTPGQECYFWVFSSRVIPLSILSNGGSAAKLDAGGRGHRMCVPVHKGRHRQTCGGLSGRADGEESRPWEKPSSGVVKLRTRTCGHPISARYGTQPALLQLTLDLRVWVGKSETGGCLVSSTQCVRLMATLQARWKP